MKFEDLQLASQVLQAITDLGFTTPSKIQKAAIKPLLSGYDVIGQAQTGTGKTLAFASVLLTKLTDVKAKQVQALILCPTRELAVQIGEEFARLGKYTKTKCAIVYGGSDIRSQIKALKAGASIVIGTPGRVMDLMRKNVLKLDEAKYVVLDEADEMLNMGFVEDIETIFKEIPSQRQTMLFSATMPQGIVSIAKNHMKSDYQTIKIQETSTTALTVEEYYFEIRYKERYEALCRLLDGYGISRAIIFCKTKKGVDELTSQMVKSGYHVEGMHGDLSQESRLETLKRFKAGKLPYLVATDVAARGIDVKEISHVINYDLPQDTESYVHRIGRTGRANHKGQALTLVTRQEKGFLKELERVHHTHIEPLELPRLKDIVKNQVDTVVQEVADVMQSGLHKAHLQQFNGMAYQDLLNVASALFYLQASNHQGYDYSIDRIGYQKPFQTLLLDLGPNFSLNQGAVLKYLIEVGKCKKDEIGKIEITNRGPQVDLMSERALKSVMKYVPETKLAGRKVRLKEIKSGGNKHEIRNDRHMGHGKVRHRGRK